jgi:hypothetical protein
VELGAVVPTPSLALVEAQLADVEPAIDAWLEDGGPALLAALPSTRTTDQ